MDAAVPTVEEKVSAQLSLPKKPSSAPNALHIHDSETEDAIFPASAGMSRPDSGLSKSIPNLSIETAINKAGHLLKVTKGITTISFQWKTKR